MNGRGRAKDNIWIKRFWKTTKYAYIYIVPEEKGGVLYSGIKRFIRPSSTKQTLHSSGSLIEQQDYDTCLKTLKNAFDECSALSTIYIPAKKTDYYKKRLPEDLHDKIVKFDSKK